MYYIVGKANDKKYHNEPTFWKFIYEENIRRKTNYYYYKKKKNSMRAPVTTFVLCFFLLKVYIQIRILNHV